MVNAKSGVGRSYLVGQMEPQRGMSHSTQDGITGSAGPGGEGGAKTADESLPKTGESGKPLTSHPPFLSALAIQLPFSTTAGPVL